MKAEALKWGKKIGAEIAKNSPVILTGLSVAGTAATAILAGKATYQTQKKIEEMKSENENYADIPVKEKALAILPFYIPAAIMFLTTTACIIGSHEISHRRQIALASAYSISTEAMKELESKVKETYGDNKSKKLRNEIATDHVKANLPREERIVLTGKGTSLFYDDISGRYFRSDKAVIDRAINDLNEMINNGDYVLLNELYSRIGLGSIKLGEQLGWHASSTGLIDITFDYIGEEVTGDPCGVMMYYVMPTFDYGN